MMSLSKFLERDDVNITSITMDKVVPDTTYVRTNADGRLDKCEVRRGSDRRQYEFDALPASHELIGHKCPVCTTPLKEGDATVLVDLCAGVDRRPQVSPGHRACVP
jgi:hypothetical protein